MAAPKKLKTKEQRIQELLAISPGSIPGKKTEGYGTVTTPSQDTNGVVTKPYIPPTVAASVGDTHTSATRTPGILEDSTTAPTGAGYESTPYVSEVLPASEPGTAGYVPPAVAPTGVAAPTSMGAGTPAGTTPTPTASAPPPFEAYEAPKQAAGLLESETVEGRMTGIMDPDSPLMKLADARGIRTAARRGLESSSLAAGESQKAMMESALPIASQDAAALQAQRGSILQGDIQKGLLDTSAYYGQALQGQADVSSMERLAAQIASDEARAAAGLRSAAELQDDAQNFAKWSQDDQQAYGLSMQHDAQNYADWEREDQQAYGAWLQTNSQEFQAWSQEDQQAFKSYMQQDANNFAEWSQNDQQAYGFALQQESQNFAEWQQKDQNAFAMHMQKDSQNFDEWKQDDQQAYGLALQQDSHNFEEWKQADQHAFTKFMQDDIQLFDTWSQNDQQAFSEGMQDDAQLWNTWSENQRDALSRWLQTESDTKEGERQKAEIEGRIDLQEAIAADNEDALADQLQNYEDQWVANNIARAAIADAQIASNLETSLVSASTSLSQTYMTEVNNINRDKNVATRDKDEAIQTATNSYHDALDAVASVYGAEALLATKEASGEGEGEGEVEGESPYVAPDVEQYPPLKPGILSSFSEK
jgi:hypothetical protein